MVKDTLLVVTASEESSLALTTVVVMVSAFPKTVLVSVPLLKVLVELLTVLIVACLLLSHLQLPLQFLPQFHHHQFHLQLPLQFRPQLLFPFQLLHLQPAHKLSPLLTMEPTTAVDVLEICSVFNAPGALRTLPLNHLPQLLKSEPVCPMDNVVEPLFTNVFLLLLSQLANRTSVLFQESTVLLVLPTSLESNVPGALIPMLLLPTLLS
jgi:hypothetical protein